MIGLLGVLGVLVSPSFAEDTPSPTLLLDQALTAYSAGDDETALTLSLRLLAAEPAHPVAQALRYSVTQDHQHRLALRALEQRHQLLQEQLERLARQAVERSSDTALMAERQRFEAASHRRQAELDRLLGPYAQPVEEALERAELVQANLHWYRMHHLSPTAPMVTQTQAVLVSALQQRLAQAEELSAQERFLLDGWLAYHRGAFDAAAQAWGKAQAIPPGDQISAALFELMALPIAHAQAQHRAQATLTERERARQTQAKAAAAQRAARDAAIQRSLREGLQSYQAGRWREAAYAFQEVLRQAPTHPQASEYLAKVQATLAQERDPQQAESHYQAGLVAYAHRQLEQARHEWELTLRFAPNHAKAQRALEKVQKELVLQ
ncbi:MAG: hypothetical protein HYZ73_07630 [Elusimicrobia bacterium]|nr:hypothetical protein [Elusimicrobiota bacterium]